MMLPSHIAIGLIVSTPIVILYPHQVTELFIIAVAGSIIPDLDILYGEHRKTLHQTELYMIGSIISIAVLLLCVLVTTTPTLLIYISGLFVSLYSHIVGDILGSGLEEKPWNQTSTLGVYSHSTQQWIAPVYIFSYDGSIRDLGVLILCSVGVWNIYSSVKYSTEFTIGLVVVGVVYTLIRRYLPLLEQYLCRHIPFLRPFLNKFHGRNIDDQ